MNKKWLFSKLTKPERNALLSTFLVWLWILFVVGIVSFPQPKTEKTFSTMNVSLTASTQKGLETVDEKNPVKKTVPKPKELTVKKTVPVEKRLNVDKSVPKDEAVVTIKKTAPQQLVKSVDELIAENKKNTSVKKTVKDVDWDSLFSESAPIATSSSSKNTAEVKSLSSADALSGVAALNAKKRQEEVSVSSDTKENFSGAVSRETRNLLNEIEEGSLSTQSRESVKTISKEVAQTGSSLKMKDGSMRRLLDPLKPEIVLSKKSESLIDSSRTVQISFIVRKDGNVESGSVIFMPEGLLPTKVRSEIAIQIGTWRFEKGESDGQAGFKYSITKQ